MEQLYERLVVAAATLTAETGHARHDVVVVLGSGLGAYPERFDDAAAVPYAALPGFPVPTAIGHGGTAHSVLVGGRRVLLLAGRAHAYEGATLDTVVFPVRTAVLAGCSRVVLTNAAGGCGRGISPGDLVVITDHINPTGSSPLAGANDDRVGPRFPDMSDVYTPALREKAHAAATGIGMELGEGIYYWWRGPMYETPAEVRMAQALGASLVGMSTVPEAIAARHMGAEVLGLSLCTNLAAGISPTRLSADEVIETAVRATGTLGDLFDALLPNL